MGGACHATGLAPAGPNAGVAYRFANGPTEAEMTGPYFTPDFQTMFLSVQHPGEETPNRGGVFGRPETYTSHWPDGVGHMPKPSVVALRRKEPLFGRG
jgi:secreted PhoX family phosphatase